MLDATLRIVEEAPLDMNIPIYASLPASPIAEPPVVKSLAELLPVFRSKVPLLEADIDAALLVIDWRADLSETFRDPFRQLWLFGIGRHFQAPGRTGVVTNIREATGNHVQRCAVDFFYRPNVGKAPSQLPEAVVLALKDIAPRLEAKYSVVWGGTWRKPDYPHWEEKK